MDVSASLAPTLQFIHAAAANISGMPFLAIEKMEAEELSKAAADVFAQYNLKVSPMVAAWLQLLTVSSAIYVPRALAFKAMREEMLRQRREANNQPEPAPYPPLTGV